MPTLPGFDAAVADAAARAQTVYGTPWQLLSWFDNGYGKVLDLARAEAIDAGLGGYRPRQNRRPLQSREELVWDRAAVLQYWEEFSRVWDRWQRFHVDEPNMGDLLVNDLDAGMARVWAHHSTG